jgi:hypothetical protein
MINPKAEREQIQKLIEYYIKYLGFHFKRAYAIKTEQTRNDRKKQPNNLEGIK